jgi:hypothetical protein
VAERLHGKESLPMAKYDKLRKFPYLLLDKRQYHKDMSCIRESYGQVNEELLEGCRKMQKEFDPKDLEQASFLAAELNTLKSKRCWRNWKTAAMEVSVIEGKN